MEIDSFTFTPHPDIELGIPRKVVEAFVALPPEVGLEPPPLVITIPGYGETANSEYFLNKLNTYLAQQYGCLAMSVNYHGITKTPQPFDFYQLEALVSELQIYYGWTPSSSNGQEAIGEFVCWASARGFRRLPTSFKRYLHFEYPEYLSFGFLPALDHFTAISELAKRHQFSQRRIVVFGSSYGGYIANLMSKFAPNTFSLVIDNSGFSHVLLRDILTAELHEGEQWREIGYGEASVHFPFAPVYPWTLNELSPAYFSDARRGIRSLLNCAHWARSASRHCIFHSVDDDLVPIREKDLMVEALRATGREVIYRRIEQADIDGKTFKTLRHGMDASLRSLFELIVPEFIPGIDSQTDYERNSTVRFPCGGEIYQFEYTPDFGFKSSLYPDPQPVELF